MKQNQNKDDTSMKHIEVFGLVYYITLCCYILYYSIPLNLEKDGNTITRRNDELKGSGRSNVQDRNQTTQLKFCIFFRPLST